MKHLVYGVRREVQSAPRTPPAGVEGAHVFLAAEGGLAAACSVVPAGCVTPTVLCATAFAGVVGAMHGAAAVLPFRYGNFLDNRGQVLDLLRVHRAEFLQSLEEVQGCDEMGLRILLEDRPGPACAPPAVAASGDTGREFLEGRRACYAAQERNDSLATRAAAEARGELEALAVKCREERSVMADSRLLSLSFLVRRAQIGCFRDAFGRLRQESSAEMLLTGPWPPYNFVGCPCSDGPLPEDRTRLVVA